jgi:hypothetical protein
MKKIFILSILLLLLLSCGYHFRGHRIEIEGVGYFTQVIVENKTYEPEIELIVKEYLTSRFSANGWLGKEGTEGEGTVFSCKVIKFENKAVSHANSDKISQYALVLLFDVAIYKKDSPSDIIFSIKKRRYTEPYIVSDDIRVTLQNKKEAIEKVSEKFSSDIEDSITQGF